MNIQVDPTSSNLASIMLNSKVRPRAVVGYGVKIFHPSPPNYVTRSPGSAKMASRFENVTGHECNLSPTILMTNQIVILVKSDNKFTCILSKIKLFPPRKVSENYLILDKTCVKIFPNFTRHHLITHTNLLSVLNFLFQSACCAANKARAQNLNERCASEGIVENEDPRPLRKQRSSTKTKTHLN